MQDQQRIIRNNRIGTNSETHRSSWSTRIKKKTNRIENKNRNLRCRWTCAKRALLRIYDATDRHTTKARANSGSPVKPPRSFRLRFCIYLIVTMSIIIIHGGQSLICLLLLCAHNYYQYERMTAIRSKLHTAGIYDMTRRKRKIYARCSRPCMYVGQIFFFIKW